MNEISDQDIASMRNHYESLKKEFLQTQEKKNIAGLKRLTQLLRDPTTGCPWDKSQTIESFADCITEEAKETVESIKNNNINNLEEELGDLLFTVLFTINLCEENNYTNLEKIADRVLKKLVFRHPHVFGENPQPNISAETAYALFQNAKKLEKTGKFN